MARELHVAALPFPSPQGTQAALAAMMDALAAAGRDVALLTYAHGDPAGAPARVPHLRLRRAYGDRSLRSGPSLAKIAQDLALVRAIARERAQLVVAHHVEAAVAAWLARARPWIFVAHTALGPELPTYLPPHLPPTASRCLGELAVRAGEALDIVLARRADAVLAISPALAARLTERAGVDARWLPLPWSVPQPIQPDETEMARAALGIEGEIVLYAGNPDAYQGLGRLVEATRLLAARRRGLRLLIATAAEDALRIDAPHVRVVSLEGGEPRRRLLHAAAQVVAVPRAVEGGLPIKLIDALARGVPVAAVERACSGFELSSVAEVVRDDDPRAFAAAIERLLVDRARALSRAAAGRNWVSRTLTRERFVEALDAVSVRARDGRT